MGNQSNQKTPKENWLIRLDGRLIAIAVGLGNLWQKIFKRPKEVFIQLTFFMSFCFCYGYFLQCHSTAGKFWSALVGLYSAGCICFPAMRYPSDEEDEENDSNGAVQLSGFEIYYRATCLLPILFAIAIYLEIVVFSVWAYFITDGFTTQSFMQILRKLDIFFYKGNGMFCVGVAGYLCRSGKGNKGKKIKTRKPKSAISRLKSVFSES